MDVLDVLLKNILKDEVNPSKQDIEKNFLKFKKTLVDNKSKRFAFQKFSYLNFKKVALVSICSLLCITTISLGYSSTVRAAAQEAFDSIKSIFVVEFSGSDLKIVQKQTSEVKERIAVANKISLSDAEIEKLVGYKILFPKKLANNFELADRYLEVGVGKQIPYDSRIQLQRQMEIAILNQEEFLKLSVYSPYRAVGSLYKYTTPNEKFGTTVLINSWPVPSGCEAYSDKVAVKIGETEGFWVKVKYPEYPLTYENGTIEANLSIAPVIRDDLYMLYWSKNNIYYSIFNPTTTVSAQITSDKVTPYYKNKDTYLSKEEAVELATEFQAAQPQ